MDLVFDVCARAQAIATDQKTYRWLTPLVLLVDAALTAVVVKRVPYTEIDFQTYIQQVSLYIWGQKDYTKIAGATGPLVYPAGHVYIYSVLYWLTVRGKEVERAQWVFWGLYLLTLGVVVGVYRRGGAPPYLIPLLILSKRLHSIFVLRLFNDCFAAFFLWAAIYAFQGKRWTLGSLMLSAGISVKMTLLLAVPGMLVLMAMALPISVMFSLVGGMVGVQLIIGSHFISHSPEEYLSRAFDFSRAFLFKWTVNWRFVGAREFASQRFARALLANHLVLLTIFAFERWTRPSGLNPFQHLYRLIRPLSPRMQRWMEEQLTVDFITTTLLTSVAIGMLCARSLHYQFFAYLAWASPWLLWKSGMHPVLIYIVWAAQEWAWNVYPSTKTSSGVVVACLVIQVVGAYWGTRNEFVDLEFPEVEADDETVEAAGQETMQNAADGVKGGHQNETQQANKPGERETKKRR